MFFDKVSLVTGGFDPIHSGHISYFKRAKDLSNYLIVGLNTEEWLTRKKGQYFQSWKERAEIISHLTMVDAVITVPDDDEGSLSWEALRRGVRYLNIETRLGHLTQQKKMLSFVESNLD